MKRFFILSIIAIALASCEYNISEKKEAASITKRQLYTEMYIEIMSYNNKTHDSTSLWSDVESNSDLSWALKNLVAAGYLDNLEYPDGKFHPDKTLLKAEVWSSVVNTIGLIAYDFDCGASDIQPDTWYQPIAGSLCFKGLLNIGSNGQANPMREMTREKWELLKANILSWMDHPATRRDALEASAVLLAKLSFLEQTSCQSSYQDVEDDSFLCRLSNRLLEEGLLDGSQDNLRPDEPIIWSELNKLMFTMGNVDTIIEYTGRSNTPQTHWAISYNDSIAARDGLHPDFIYNQPVQSLQYMYQSIWMFHSRFMRE